MYGIDCSAAVGQLVAEEPRFAPVLYRFAIDYCCTGHQSLSSACAALSLDPCAVSRELDAARKGDAGPQEPDWSARSPGALADRIVSAYHRSLKEELPRLSRIIAKVATSYGDFSPLICALDRTFDSFKSELEPHMLKEEMVIFPLCRRLDAGLCSHTFRCGNIRVLVEVMEEEHRATNEVLKQMRMLVAECNFPPEAYETCNMMVGRLAALDAETQFHIHLENNILFRQAVARERTIERREQVL